MKRLLEVLAGPLGRPRAPGIMFRGLRTVSFDGCKSLRVAGTGENRAWLGKQNASSGETGCPSLLLMTLAETGTWALPAAVFASQADGEMTWAGKLPHLPDGSFTRSPAGCIGVSPRIGYLAPAPLQATPLAS